MRFGLYLVRRGLVAPEELVAALEKQQRDLPRLGQLAIEEGMLTVREVFEVLRHQAPLGEERFGERAIELGLLKRPDVGELLMIQSDRCRPVSDILVERGVLTREQEQREREAFCAALDPTSSGNSPSDWRSRAEPREPFWSGTLAPAN